MDALDLLSFNTAHEPRPHVNALIRHHHAFTVDERLAEAQKVGWNVFQFPSEMLRGGDLLSDSGTTVLTAEQFAALVLGDEAYGSNWGYFQLLEAFERTLGIKLDEWELYLFHQGRAAEHALFTHIGREGLVIPANGFFDTTRANIENAGMTALDMPCEANAATPFAGNTDMLALARLFRERGSDGVPLAYCTITNNTGGGQPVSLANLRAMRRLCDRYGASFFLDACRFAENAWFIKERERGFSCAALADIAREEFSLCDGFTISLKKDGLANMGGALAIRKSCALTARYPLLLEELRDHQILVEGHPTYGGLSGRDIMTIALGLKTVVTEEYMRGRIAQVRGFGEYLASLGVPVVEPIGGHAVYIDIDRFFGGTRMRRGDYGGIALAGLLLGKGVRLCELGEFAFGTYDAATGRETFPAKNLLRAAVPRNKYEAEDLKYVADCVRALHDRRDQIPRAICTFGREKTLRHFKARFRLEDIAA